MYLPNCLSLQFTVQIKNENDLQKRKCLTLLCDLKLHV